MRLPVALGAVQACASGPGPGLGPAGGPAAAAAATHRTDHHWPGWSVRCVATPSATDCEECVGCHQCSHMYCQHCRNRTGNLNTFSADIGSRFGCHTLKRDELARHERIFHPVRNPNLNKVGSGNDQMIMMP